MVTSPLNKPSSPYARKRVHFVAAITPAQAAAAHFEMVHLTTAEVLIKYIRKYLVNDFTGKNTVSIPSILLDSAVQGKRVSPATMKTVLEEFGKYWEISKVSYYPGTLGKAMILGPAYCFKPKK